MSGHTFRSWCSLGSTSSTIEPLEARSYFGAPDDASAAFTVFFDTPSSRAMALIGMPSARCNLLISAQSPTLSTFSLPGSFEPGSLEGVSFQASPGGQFSRVANTDRQDDDLGREAEPGESRARDRAWAGPTSRVCLKRC